MRAIQIQRTGGPEVLTPAEVPTPQPGPGQLLVRLQSIGINFIDIYKRSGLYALPLPAILGEEGAGVVEAVGPQVRGYAPGDRVAYCSATGSYAEFQVVPAERVVRVPEAVSSDQAAALMLQGMTAHYLVRSTFPLAAGQTCVVHAAAGGVGLLLTQLARALGARVIATASTAEKRQLARQAGASLAVPYEELVAAVKDQTAGKGAEVVYDGVGVATWEASLSSLAPRGTLALYGQSSGPVAKFDPQELNRRGGLFLTRPSLAHYLMQPGELEWRASELFKMVQSGDLSLRIGGTWPLDQAAQAQAALAERRTTGKLLLHP
jgi:NADPH2:quinone reductase